MAILAVALIVAVAFTQLAKPPKPWLYLPNLGLGGFAVYTTAWGNGSTIPSQYACHNANFTSSPPLVIVNVPNGTRSLLIILVDPNASYFIHWALLVVNASAGSIPGNIPSLGVTPYGVQFRDSYGIVGFGGPCPPSRHMYILIAYALNYVPNLSPGSYYGYDLYVSIASGHVYASSIWVGYYG